MMTFVAAGIIFGLAMLGLSLGVILSGRCIRGSCGGVGHLRDSSGKQMCDHCPNRDPESEQTAKA
jgi:hypothetical protein